MYIYAKIKICRFPIYVSMYGLYVEVVRFLISGLKELHSTTSRLCPTPFRQTLYIFILSSPTMIFV